jgi:hypothetical protein
MTLARSRMVRDVVEICAIVIAGVWAFYIFVFQNVLVPSFANPTPTFTVQMRHVGNDGPFAVIRIDETIHNIGTVPIHFLAHAVTVLGTEVAARPPGARPPAAPGEFSAYAQFSAPKIVYEKTIVTHLGDPKQDTEILLEPGTQTEFALEFYVPRDRFSRLVAWLAAGYTKTTRTIPTAIKISRTGVRGFDWTTDDVFQTFRPAAELDLKAE